MLHVHFENYSNPQWVPCHESQYTFYFDAMSCANFTHLSLYFLLSNLLPPSLPHSTVVAIEPPINAQWDLSSYHIGSNITIGCPVQTCAEQVSIQFLKGASVVKKYLDRQQVTNSAYVLTLPVSEDIVGMYACKVDTTNADHSAMQYFEIIGTCHSIAVCILQSAFFVPEVFVLKISCDHIDRHA